MAKAELKTKKTKQSVIAFLNTIKDLEKKKDAKKILALMKEITGERPQMWGDSMVGFGDYHYTYASGREGDWFLVGFSPRKQNLTIYIMPGYKDYGPLMKKLGPHALGKSCLYIKRLDDMHIPTLKKLIKTGYQDMKKKYKK
ncbi:MAG: hypothetical protein COU90_02540 [Candidatus Ryanbacteria bacterium CG10_big_fil_rev_8_21_14_0_10_43_42]|uniref:YdhG-like domain-containing protein n=1 Tax=Candidatus Ryanbacteria bacterium CG10_big_fil_rev_8_21_14_0_10_43_42 TaxID=1974864 RepID=A0A2M8KWJ0_9BACT|nr:MAG: hypothetical protein COU90_02540 [Candidatus Ryanbacteria bacterium CG10_big_fil_rev_8_21_14_0_10_43_42]